MKGQASLEQLIVTGIGITFIALIFYFAINSANDNVQAAQAKDSVDKMVKAADYVYSLGPGSRHTIGIYLPQGVEFVNISGKRIHIQVSIPSGNSDAFANTRANVSGNVQTTGGARKITLNYNETINGVSING